MKHKLFDELFDKEFKAPIYENIKDYQEQAEKYFDKFRIWREEDYENNFQIWKDPKYSHYIGYMSIQNGWDIRQAEIDEKDRIIKELENIAQKWYDDYQRIKEKYKVY